MFYLALNKITLIKANEPTHFQNTNTSVLDLYFPNSDLKVSYSVPLHMNHFSQLKREHHNNSNFTGQL